VVGGDADGLPNGGDPPGTGSCGTGMGQRRLGIFVEKLSRCHQVPRHHIGRAAVQCRELATDLGCQLFGFDVRRYPRTFGAWRLSVGFGLLPARPVRTR
jgi:hypothetical protein